MPFSDDFHVHRNRGTKVTGLQGISDKSGVVTFTKSTEHASVQSYDVRVYSQGGSTILVNKNIGKPVPESNGNIRADITDILTPLSAGNYTVKVAAIGSGGTSESTGDDFSLPLT
jgi:hypothetical protein